MRRLIKWSLISLVGLVVLVSAAFFGTSEFLFRRHVEPPMPVVQAATDAGAVARGEHLGLIYGCAGCHGRSLQGEVFYDDPQVATLYSANLTRAVPGYTDAQLARAIRQGARADGSPLWGMPSESWIEVTDAEMADLLAWLRSHPPAGKPTPPVRMGLMGRVGIITGQFKASTAYVEESKARPSLDAGPAFARGRHLASTVCSECHRSDLKGDGDGTPDLMIAAAYNPEDFSRLMRTGIGADGKEHGLMTEVARGRFVHLTDQEVADLHGYFRARADRTQ